MGALTLRSADLEATFVPEAGMVCSSLRHRGEELLGQRGGLDAYVAERSTMGIPLLYPWANRLGERRFDLAGERWTSTPPSAPPSTDPQGLPIHGLLAAASGWEVLRHAEGEDGRGDRGGLRLHRAAGVDRRLPVPPTPCCSRRASRDRPLTIAITVAAAGVVPVPVSFGFHPYLRLPGVERGEWQVEIPVGERLLLDARMLPSGERESVRIEPARSAREPSTTPSTRPRPGAAFALTGGGRRIELASVPATPTPRSTRPPTTMWSPSSR